MERVHARSSTGRPWRQVSALAGFAMAATLIAGPTGAEVASPIQVEPEPLVELDNPGANPLTAVNDVRGSETLLRTQARRTAQPTPTTTAAPNVFDERTIARYVATEELRENFQAIVDSAVEELALTDADAVASVSLRLGDATAMFNEAAPTASASAAKTFWVAAAIDAVGVEAVEPFAESIFVHSDNNAAGRVIDLVGVDAINAYTGSIGMHDTFLASWFYGRSRAASNRGQFGHPASNQTTTDDALTFLEQLIGGELFDTHETSALLGWMLQTPDNLDDARLGLGGVLTNDLDPWVATTSMHKAGWLPPNCCRAIGNVLIALGVVPITSSEPLLVAVSTLNGTDYEADTAWISKLVSDLVRAASDESTGPFDP